MEGVMSGVMSAGMCGLIWSGVRWMRCAVAGVGDAQASQEGPRGLNTPLRARVLDLMLVGV
eukprot:1293669-Rhodomonas_salina.1